MKILSIHNRYLQPGGEDVAVAAEKALLEAHGHRVVDYHRSNAEIDERGLSKARVAAKAFWAADTVHELERLLGEEKPDIAHFHNTLTMISPAAYYACRRARVPVVQTLHNYRLICPRADLFRSGRICEDCVGRAVPWPAVLHGCYHASRVETAAVASAISLHWLIRTWRRAVDVYITPSEFARSKLVAGGVPAAKLFVKPNFLATDPGRGARQGGYALFSGRFTPIEKLETLLGAWSKLRTDARLKLIGATAEERESMERRFAARGLKNVEVLGWQPRPRLFELLKEAVF
ncbi:MAG: glycosyltransferase, partial [Candidatus Binataceae bacterium]